MAVRNLTEVFFIMRNNASKRRNIYSDNRKNDSDKLLKRSLTDAEEGLELRDDFVNPPIWIDKLEEAQYTMSKIKPKLDELGSLHARHLLRPTFNDSCEEEEQIEELSIEITKLLSSAHRHIQCIRSSLNSGNIIEQRLTKNVVTYLLLALQELTTKYRSSQNNYINQLKSREETSSEFFETSSFTNIDLNDEKSNNVESFDNFFKPKSIYNIDIQNDDQIDEDFQKPVSKRLTQQQLLLFEEENTKLADKREEEVNKIVKSIRDLNEIYKDLGQMVQEQGTIIDRIDYNIEQTQARVIDGVKQLHKAEIYQRKNRKIICILILASITLFLLLLLIFTKL